MKFGVFFFTIFLTIGWLPPCHAQKIKSPEEVLKALEVDLRSKQGNRQEVFRVYSKTFQTLVNRGNYKLADSLLSITDKYTADEKDSSFIIEYKSAKAFLFKLNFSYSQSLAEYLEIRAYYSSKADIDKICLVDAQIGEFYRAQGNGELCKKFIDEAMSYLKSGKVTQGTKAFLYSRMASYQGQFLGNEDGVLRFSTMALDTALATGNKYVAAMSQNELGYYYMNNYPEDSIRSLGYYRNAMDNFLAEDRYRDCLSVSQNMARSYLYIGAYQKAIDVLNEAIANAIKNGWGDHLDHAYYIMTMSHNYLGNQSEVQKYFDLAQETLVIRLNAQHAIEVGQLTANFDKNVAELAMKEAQEDAKNSKTALNYIVALSLILLIAIIAVARLFSKARKNNNQLKEQRSIIEVKNLELVKAVEEKEVLYKELNHRVKNNLMVLSGLIYLQKENNEHTSPETDELYNSLRNRIQTMAIVHEKLYGSDGATDIDFEDYLKELITLILASFTLPNDKLVPFKVSCKNLKFPIDQAIPLALIFNELVTNSVKHGTDQIFEKGISIASEEDSLKIIYTDSGIGIEKNLELSEAKTMGMKIIRLMTIQLKAKIEFPESYKGFKAEITLPTVK